MNNSFISPYMANYSRLCKIQLLVLRGELMALIGFSRHLRRVMGKSVLQVKIAPQITRNLTCGEAAA
jgi:hypothetical protein